MESDEYDSEGEVDYEEVSEPENWADMVEEEEEIDIGPTFQEPEIIEQVRSPRRVSRASEEIRRMMEAPVSISRKRRSRKKNPFREYRKIVRRGPNPPSERAIIETYFQKEPEPQEGYQYLRDGTIRKVYHDPKHRFPIPKSYKDRYPVYGKSQLEELNFLLNNGVLCPWLVGKVKPVYNNGTIVDFTGNPPWIVQDKEKAIKFLNSERFRDMDNRDKFRIVMEIMKDFNLFQYFENKKTVLEKLRKYKEEHPDKSELINNHIRSIEDNQVSINDYVHILHSLNIRSNIPSIGAVKKLIKTSDLASSYTNYYVLQEFKDGLGNPINVKEGVGANRIVWSSGDPCGYFTGTQKSIYITNTLSQLDDTRVSREYLEQVMNYWGLRGEVTVNNVRNQLLQIKNNLGEPNIPCISNNKYQCTWTGQKCIATQNWKPTMTKRTEALYLWDTYKDLTLIENLSTRLDKNKFKENVWNWIPPGKPRDRRQMERWKERPYVKQWNDAITQVLGILKNILEITSINSTLYLQKRNELEQYLESVRQRLMLPEIIRKPREVRMAPDVDIELMELNGNNPQISQEIMKLVNEGIITIEPEARALITRVNTNDFDIKDLIKSYKRYILLSDKSEKQDNRIYIYNILRNMGISDYEQETTITLRNVLDYIGDSYGQYQNYDSGIITDVIDREPVIKYLQEGCKYTREQDPNNNLVFMDNYFVAQFDLHTYNSVSTPEARRLALVLGIDLSHFPPCFSTFPRDRNERRGPVITMEDVKMYFNRDGHGLYLEELEAEDLKNARREKKEAWNRLQPEVKDRKKRYQKALRKMRDGDSLDSVANEENVDIWLLNKLYKEMMDIESQYRTEFIRIVKIPWYINRNKDREWETIKETFEEMYGFPLYEWITV